MARILKVEENTKLHDAPSLGGLIGRSRLPSLRAVRRTMAVLVENVKEKIHDLKIEFAKRCISLGEAGLGYRRVFFMKRGEKISVAITCKKEAGLDELVLDLTRRWGAQENPFKELKKDGYDSLHSYEKDKFSEQYLSEENLDPTRTMDNPEYATLQRERRKLKTARERILGRNGAKEKKPSKGQREKLEQIESRLAQIQGRLAHLPQKILRMDHIESNGIVRLQNNKKKYFDLMNFLAYNTRRDIHQIVLKFLNTSATVRQRAGHTDIILPAPSKNQEKAALQHLCETLTAMEKTSRLFPGKLVYHVQ